jgi:hypothetical protein
MTLSDVVAEQRRQGGILERLEGFFTGSDPHDQAPAAETGGPDIAGEIRRQLDERDAKAKKDKPADPPKAPDPKELAEKQPEPMTRRVERWMGWTQ